jgi:hypothetical protein
VRRRQPRRRLLPDAHDVDHFQRPGPVQPGLQGLAGDVLHHQVRQPVHLADAVNGDDMVVADRGGGLRLAGEAPPGRGAAGQDRRHDLDGDRPVQRRLERLQHDAHAALADDPLHLVLAQQAQEARPVGRGEEVQVGRFRRSGPGPRLPLQQPPQHLHQRRVVGHGRRVADLPGLLQPVGLGWRQPVEALPAGRARLQVALVALLVVPGEGGGEHPLPGLRLGAVERCGHGGPCAGGQSSCTDCTSSLSRAKTRLRAR